MLRWWLEPAIGVQTLLEKYLCIVLSIAIILYTLKIIINFRRITPHRYLFINVIREKKTKYLHSLVGITEFYIEINNKDIVHISEKLYRLIHNNEYCDEDFFFCIHKSKFKYIQNVYQWAISHLYKQSFIDIYIFDIFGYEEDIISDIAYYYSNILKIEYFGKIIILLGQDFKLIFHLISREQYTADYLIDKHCNSSYDTSYVVSKNSTYNNASVIYNTLRLAYAARQQKII